MVNLGSAAIIVPTLNAQGHLDRLLPALLSQSVPLENIWIVDSSSTDATAEICRSAGLQVHVIPRSEFNHGGTRKLGTELCSQAEFLVFLTQDALPAERETVVNLLKAFEDSDVGMAYGRQLPKEGAGGIEAHARLFGYPDKSQIKRFSDRERLGIRTPFCSNSFAAYRRSALESVGNFPADAYLAEDNYVAAKMLIGGWKVAYCADSCVYHSHTYTVAQDFKRYFDIGVFHSQNGWFVETFGRPEGEGVRAVIAEVKYLWRYEPRSLPSAFVRTIAKLIAYHIGLRHRLLPMGWRVKLAMSGFYWRQQMAKSTK